MSIYNKLSEEPEKKETVQKESDKDIKISRYQDISKDDTFEHIRSVVRVVGKETSPLRVTPLENDSLEDVIYHFRKRGIRSDKNEVVRIALNYLLLDHEKNKGTSILAKALERINS